MALKRPAWPEGRVVILEHHSIILKGNPLGDPHVRKLAVWLPHEYDEGAGNKLGKRFPVLFDLVGFMGSGLSHVAWQGFTENIPERIARMTFEGKMPPAIVVFPDCFTSLGGNQYVNSSAIGNYADYLTRELIPFIDREFRTHASRDKRGCFGKSSGGYGAILHGMKYAKYWGAVASHSGDAYFDFVYMRDWPQALTTLTQYRQTPRVEGAYNVLKEEKHLKPGMDDGRVKNFLNYVWKKEKLNEAEGHTLMLLAMAATYDPNPKAPLGFHLPFNLETGELITQRWKKWQQCDPINLVSKYRDNLQTLKTIYIDCGWRDQYAIHFGARILSKRLKVAGVKHHYAEFDGTHSAIDYRIETSLPILLNALK
jgi:S-formylglutathione hydrolase FrmB